MGALKRVMELTRQLNEAMLDDLTGALRRGIGAHEARREIERSERVGEPLVVAMVDVDGLKEINDRFGHPAGDQVLRQLVAFITAQVRAYDLVIRYGGDEFICVLRLPA